MKVGDIVKNIHALYPAETGIIIEICTHEMAKCPYMVHWFDGYEPAWMRADWLEMISESR